MDEILTEKEQAKYSLLNGLRNQMSGKRGFEHEVGEEFARKNGVEARGLYVPHEMLGSRTMSVTDTTYGGNTVATNIAAGSFIDALIAQSVVLGISTRLDGLVGNVQIPRMSGVSTVYKPAEKSAITQSNISTDYITLSPTRYGASVPVTKQLLMQSSLSVENIIRNDIARQIALAIESDVIGGILSGTNVGLVALGTNGLAPTNQNFIDLETLVTAANAAMGNLKYLVNAKGRGKLKSTPKVSGYPSFVLENDMVNGYETMMTNLVPSNLTKGTGTNLSAAIFGNFDDVITAFWGGLDILVDPYTQAKEGIINITADQFADYDLRHGESFAVIKDMITA